MANAANPPSFDAFAEHYDRYTAGYQAAAWTGKLEALLLRRGLCGNRLLDVGCGTGKSLIPMRERGWNVVGCDLSPAMLEIAREKSARRCASLLPTSESFPSSATSISSGR